MSLKPITKIKFQNGLTFDGCVHDILSDLQNDFDFVDSSDPDFIVFGPYGNDVPPPGNYKRIGYFCENIKPDLSICEWAFGIPLELEINDPRYKRIQWHGFNAEALIKPAGYDAEKILSSKSKFCNFFYSHPVPYREAFFKQLSKYKKVDAPGSSMNNILNIDSLYSGNRWEVKRKFLGDYKFTIAFENDIYPGYQTEKLYDAMQVNSLPIYCGDPLINDVFNTGSFVNLFDHIAYKKSFASEKIRKAGQMDFDDILPGFLNGPKHRLKRKAKSYLREFKHKILFSKMDFTPLIDQIIAIDKDPELHLKYLQQPWFKNNTINPRLSTSARWREIFNSR